MLRANRILHFSILGWFGIAFFGLNTVLYSQDEILANDQSLGSALDSLERIYDIFFVFESELRTLKNTNNSNVIFSRVNLLDDLEQLVKVFEVEYFKISARTYALRLSNRYGVIKGKIIGPNSRPLPGATIQINETGHGAAADLNGNYQLRLQPGAWQLITRFVGMSEYENETQIQAGEIKEKDIQLSSSPYLEEVVVIGSRISPSTMIDNASIVTILKADREGDRAFQDLGELLHKTIPSFYSTHQTIADGTDHIDPASLRGLGPDQVLVLINGKRRHQSALVNINGTVGKGTVSTDLGSIPASAIERIEILQDGASVQYGSDAIAGVINIVLKEDKNYSEFVLKSGITSQGDGFNNSFKSRLGMGLFRNGSIDVSFEFNSRGGINRSGTYTGPIYADERDDDFHQRSLFFDHLENADGRVMRIGGSEMITGIAFINARIPIDKKSEFYFFGGASYKSGSASGFYRFPYQESRQSGLYDFGFAPELSSNIVDQSLCIGAKIERNGWEIDISNTIGKNNIGLTVSNSNNASLGLSSPTKAYTGGFDYVQNTINLDLQREKFSNLPIDLAGGAEFRLERFMQNSGEKASWEQYFLNNKLGKEGGIQMFPGFRPENEVNRLRYNIGAYGIMEYDPSEQLKVGYAMRFEQYEDFGNNLSWRGYMRYKLSNRAVLKAAYNTGFRAPSLPQIYFSSTSNQFITNGSIQESVRVAHFNNESPITSAFGIEPLVAETSSNINIGMSLYPIDNLSFTLNTYQLDIDDRVIITGRFTTAMDDRIAEILNSTGVRQAQFFTNAIQTRTHGLEASINYSLKLKKGRVNLSGLYSYNQTNVKRDASGKPVIQTSQLLEEFGEVLFNREEVSRLEAVQPSSKFIFNSSFSSKKVDINISSIRYGSVAYVHPNDGEVNNWVINSFSNVRESRDQIFEAKWITDLSATYHLTPSANLTLGASNIFNVMPDEHSHSANTANGNFIYSRRVQQFGLNGAYYYGQLALRF